MNSRQLIVPVLLVVLSASVVAESAIPEKVSDWIPTDIDFAAMHPFYGAANRVGTVWDVYKSAGNVKVRKNAWKQDYPSIEVAGGKLLCANDGEFGSTVFWQPGKAEKVAISHDQVQEFFSVSDHIYALSGIAHGGTNVGEVLSFVRAEKTWAISRLCKLADEPQVAVPETTKTFLVLTYSSLCRVSIDGWIQLLVVSARWNGLHPRSLVVGDDGFAYVGFSQRIAKVDLKTGDTTYLIPYEGIFEDDVKIDSVK
ncbi:hypothetical protein [Prosthecobacter sp.]|uniref:hypothetical protein n=1 Tax=Prosthecobacter sp. TaxID=1965333 RepID=UPI003784F326